MLNIESLTYRIGGKLLFDDVNLFIPEGYKVGFFGPNGAGKTTFFKLLQHKLEADAGDIILAPHLTIGTLEQDGPQDLNLSPLEHVQKSHRELAHWLYVAESSEDPNQMAEAYEHLERLDAYTAESRAEKLLLGLGFKREKLNNPLNTFSGGWRMRASLAALLFTAPDLLLLDEPTNHLDLESSLWLQEFLTSYPKTVILISHERTFLEEVVDHILFLDQKKLKLYQGSLSTFLKTKELEDANRQAQFAKIERETAHMQKFVDRFGAKASKATQAQSKAKAIAKLKEKQKDYAPLMGAQTLQKIVFPDVDELASPVIKLTHARAGYDDGPDILKDLTTEITFNPRIALLGANGNGKSTLAKILAKKLALRSGELFHHPKLKIGYFTQYQTEQLDIHKTPIEVIGTKKPNFNMTQIRAHLGRFLLGREHAEMKVGNLSGGEKVRLVLALLTLDAPHFLILDEPTNHLDIYAREALVAAIKAFKGGIIIVSHDFYFLGETVDQFFIIENNGMRPHKGSLDDYREMLLARKDEKPKKQAKASQKTEEAQEKPKVKKPSPSTIANKQKNLEKEIERFNAEKEALEKALEDPDLFKKDAGKGAELSKELEAVNKKLSTAESDWLDYEHMKDA